MASEYMFVAFSKLVIVNIIMVYLFLYQAIDNDPSKKLGDFEDTSQVEKYEISEEAYSKRSGEVVITIRTLNVMPQPAPPQIQCWPSRSA